jgi:iron complex outermembrane receptor protein
LGTVVDAGTTPTPGVTGPTTYNPATGFASRHYYATWQAVTGTAGLEWTPDSDTLVYGKYSRGYKSGGYNIGIFTVLSFQPLTAAEHVDSFEIGLKKTLFRTLTADMAAFYYNYANLQIPITIIGTAGGLTQASTAFYNVPSAVSRGFEIETTWTPIHNLSILFDYSFLDAYSKSGAVVDTADPDALAPGAKPLPCTTATPCTPDTFTGGMQRFQSLAGNKLPNAPANKIAINGTYSWDFQGGTMSASLSYIWRDAQYGALFTRSYNRSPSWDQVDARLTWNSPNGRFKIIGYGKNLFNKVGYDAGAYGTRLAGTNDNNLFLGQAPNTFIQSPGIVSTYSVTPPRTYGVEIDYKFF